MVKVNFKPTDITVSVAKGRNLFEAAIQAGVDVDTVCGGSGLCGKCKVQVIQHEAVPAKPIDHVHLTGDEIARGMRLCCQIDADRDLAIDVPANERRSLQILHHGQSRDVPLRPNVLKIHLPYASARERDGVADWDAVKSVLPPWFRRVDVPLPWLRQLPGLIRDEAGMTLTVVGRKNVIRIESGDTSAANCGLAVDIGSTSVVAYLLDLDTGEALGVASELNDQAVYGVDIIARLARAQFSEAGLRELHKVIVAQLDAVFRHVLKCAGLPSTAVSEVTIVGNMAMHHFLLRLDSTYLGLSPYAPVTRDPITVSAGELGIDLEPDTPIYVLPNIAGFVGSDTVGVILASGMAHDDGISMAVDVGTNGEVVVGSRNGLIACSAPAGPAFEGARIKHGMRASTGAIDHVAMENDVSFSVIGGDTPVGICGSALIDIVAEMLRTGLMDYTGRLVLKSELPASIPQKLVDRLVDGDRRGNSYFVLVREGESGAVSDILFTQQDIREFQLAKGAIRAGQMVLLKHYGAEDADLVEVMLAGAFGTFIDLENARRVNLVPPLDLDRLSSIGNAAGVGAKLALLSTRERNVAERIGRDTRHLRLSGLGEFQEAFIHAMRFPRTDSPGGI